MAAAPDTGKQYLIDRGTGVVTEVAPGQPVVIIKDSPPPSESPLIQATDANGNPLKIDLSTFFKLEEHKAKMESDKESHEARMEIGKAFKDLLSKASTAVGRMQEEG